MQARQTLRVPLPLAGQGCPGKKSVSRIKALQHVALTLVASLRDLKKFKAIKLSLMNPLKLFPGPPCLAGRVGVAVGS